MGTGPPAQPLFVGAAVLQATPSGGTKCSLERTFRGSVHRSGHKPLTPCGDGTYLWRFSEQG